MSRFLKYLFKKSLIPFILVICSAICFIVKMNICGFLFVVGFIAYCFICVLQILVIKKINSQSKPFSAFSNIRNVKYLILGDMYKPTEQRSFVQIASPERTLESCYEILRHTHSILDEKNGTVVIAIKRENINKNKFSELDLSFFHTITLKRLGIKRTKNYLTRFILLHPIRTILFLLGRKKPNYTEENIEENKIKSFCQERGYNLVYKIR